VLPQSGQYTVLVDPQVRLMGITQLRLIRAVDQIGQITVDGPVVATREGEAQPWTVPATGTYSVIIDPPGPDTGTAQVTLVRA
jgi:hypothetical protein